MHNLFSVYFVNLFMFRAYLWPIIRRYNRMYTTVLLLLSPFIGVKTHWVLAFSVILLHSALSLLSFLHPLILYAWMSSQYPQPIFSSVFL